MGVLGELEEEMGVRNPAMLKFAKGMTAVPPKAYRWVREMEEIALTHAEEGGWEGVGNGMGIFEGVAELYRSVAEDPVLGAEKTERRKRGLTTGELLSFRLQRLRPGVCLLTSAQMMLRNVWLGV